MLIFKVLSSKNKNIKHHFTDENYKKNTKEQGWSCKTFIFRQKSNSLFRAEYCCKVFEQTRNHRFHQ
jgi:hypothetical protein